MSNVGGLNIGLYYRPYYKKVQKDGVCEAF